MVTIAIRVILFFLYAWCIYPIGWAMCVIGDIPPAPKKTIGQFMWKKSTMV
jgi:hypothetical protein